MTVGEEGLEPSRVLPHRNLNPARLPIPPLARVEAGWYHLGRSRIIGEGPQAAIEAPGIEKY